MNTIVSFELAKLLKEAGFGELSQNWYSVEGGLYYDGEFDNSRGFIPVCECEAPTIAEVIMWIYEKYKVWVVINITISSDWYFELYDLNSKRNAEIKVDANLYNSPSEAYEAAIKYCLTEIIKL